MMKSALSLGLILCYLSINSALAITIIEYSRNNEIQIQKWEVLDIEFSARAINNPFDVKFEAKFLSPSGEELIVPGFFNGDDTYIIRFSANRAGNWSFTTNSELKKLDVNKGTITVSEQAYQKRHGGIIIDTANVQHLVYEDGTPYFLMAYELDWLFALDYGKNTHPDATKILDKVAQNGFNQIVMNVFAYDINWPPDTTIQQEHNYGSPDFFPFLGENTNPNFSSLNVAFFQHFDEVIELLNDRDIVSHLMIYVWNKQVNWPEMYSKADNRYFDYVLKRYQAFPNMLWDISKEALLYGRCDEEYLQERISRVRKLDTYKRLLTVHDYGFCRNNSEIVDFISIQHWGTALHTEMMKTRNDFSNMPIFNIEHGGYERNPYVVFPGNYDTPESCLRRNYMCAFAGAYSTHYWQSSAWSIIIPDIESLPREQQPKLEYYKHFTNFFNEYDFHSLLPLPEGTSSGWAMTNEKGRLIFFAPDENCSIHLRVPETDKKLKFTWFNPLTGEYSEPYVKEWEWSLWEYTPVQGQDWLLVVEELNRK